MSKVNEFLVQKKQEFGSALAERWATIEELYNKRLYHQLTLRLLELVQLPQMQTGDQLIQLYHNFIAHFENKINPLSLVEIVVYVIRQITDPNEAIKFLSTLENKVKANSDSLNLCKVLAAQIYLEKFNDFNNTKRLIEEIEETLDDAVGVTLVHGRFYAVASSYYRLTNNHAEYYRTALRYLGCIELDTLTKEAKHQQAFFLCLAALLGDKVYNLGELLAHPIVEALKNTENEWLMKLVIAFNKGDINKFEKMKPKWSSIGDLQQHEGKLRVKISLLCLLEGEGYGPFWPGGSYAHGRTIHFVITKWRKMNGSNVRTIRWKTPIMAFKRPAHFKQLTFNEISKETKLPLNEIELLVMKAMSQNLLKGAIDQVSALVNFTWVQPRVLDQSQITYMAEHLDHWSKYVTWMEELLEKKTSDIISVDVLTNQA